MPKSQRTHSSAPIEKCCRSTPRCDGCPALVKRRKKSTKARRDALASD